MIGTRDPAARKFTELVKLAGGNALLVYEAFRKADPPTELSIREYIAAKRKDTP